MLLVDIWVLLEIRPSVYCVRTNNEDALLALRVDPCDKFEVAEVVLGAHFGPKTGLYHSWVTQRSCKLSDSLPETGHIFEEAKMSYGLHILKFDELCANMTCPGG
jgi:hypothetical protein